MRKILIILVCSTALIALSSREAQSQYSLPASGSPLLLRGSKTVSMQAENIHITIEEKVVKADCTFNFKNSGQACSIKIGFSDSLQSSTPPDGASSIFNSFTSYIDGKRSKTKFASVGRNFYQVMPVNFTKNGKRLIRVKYTIGIGGFLTSNGYVSEVIHISHNGASWKDKIGRSTTMITFNRSMGAKQLIPVPLSSVTKDMTELGQLDWPAYSKGSVIYKGLSKPTVKGKTLIFTQSNWRPSQKDDITVWFGYRSNEQMRR